jgi:hypothetical protein
VTLTTRASQLMEQLRRDAAPLLVGEARVEHTAASARTHIDSS